MCRLVGNLRCWCMCGIGCIMDNCCRLVAANGRPSHAGGSQGAPDSQLAAELAQQMSDQARAQAAMAQGQPHMAGHQQGAGPYHPSRAVHLFAGIANWLSRLNEAGSSRSWPNIDLPYPISSQSERLPI